jgi:hypothetical protein
VAQSNRTERARGSGAGVVELAAPISAFAVARARLGEKEQMEISSKPPTSKGAC